MNLKKIIEERLENARLDFLNAINNGKATDREIGELQYTVLTYQDCLNLIEQNFNNSQLGVRNSQELTYYANANKPAPRTEQEILDEFEKLGWIVSLKDNCDITLRYKEDRMCSIWIDKINRGYSCNTGIDMQEHKLLNELFEVIFDE